MNLTWDLSELFQSTEDFYHGMEETKIMVSQIKRYENAKLDENSLFDMLQKEQAIKEKTKRILIYGSLVYYKNIKSEECTKQKSDAENFNNEVNAELQFIQRKIINLGKETVDTYISKNKDLEIYRLYLDNLFRMQKHVQDENTNNKIKSNINSINDTLSLYNAMIKDMDYGSIEVDNKTIELTSSNIAKYLSARNEETRKQTYFAVNQAFQKQENAFAKILNTILGCRNENANLEKYDFTLEKALFEENIDPKIIESLIKAIHNNLGLFSKIFKIESGIIKHQRASFI